MNYILLILFFLILIIFYILNRYINKRDDIEHFCKIKKYNNFGAINDKRVLLNYAPQENISISSCQEYWKQDPVEYNNNLVGQTTAMPLKSDELTLPKEKQFGDNSYAAGLIEYRPLANLINDQYDEKVNDDFLKSFDEKLINPITFENLEYEYNLKFEYDKLNKKTWVNRWQQFNPLIKNSFSYDEIKSDIDEINRLNLEFLARINEKQKVVLTDKQLTLFGLRLFQIFKFKIVRIEYKDKAQIQEEEFDDTIKEINPSLNIEDTQNNIYKNIITNPNWKIPKNREFNIATDKLKPQERLYTITIALYRPSDIYMSVFSYMGIIINGEPKIYNTTYMGGNSMDHYLLSDYYNPNELKQEIINDNYSNKVKFETNADAIVKIEKDQEEKYKTRDQYGCFNILDTNGKEGYLLPYYNKETCESMFDEYGKQKPVGIYDYPCKTNEECPFYKLNKNYPNDYGKCLPTGYCQLPSNMEPVGYHYFRPNKKPLCYNCKTSHNKAYDKFGEIDTCCDEQNNRSKYPNLNSPDYAFENDLVDRQNFHMEKNCYTRYEDGVLICGDIKSISS